MVGENCGNQRASETQTDDVAVELKFEHLRHNFIVFLNGWALKPLDFQNNINYFVCWITNYGMPRSRSDKGSELCSSFT